MKHGTLLAAAASAASALGLFFYSRSPDLTPRAHSSTLRTPAEPSESPQEVRRAPSSSTPALLTSAARPAAIASAKVARDPVFDRAQRLRLVALGERRLETLKQEFESLPESERAVLSFRMARMERQLTELRARR